jgi:hypothetical protein
VNVDPHPGTDCQLDRICTLKNLLGQMNTPSLVLLALLAISVAMEVTFILGILDLTFPPTTSVSSGMTIRGELCDIDEPCDEIDRAGDADRADEADE